MAKLTAPLMSQDARGRCFGDMQIGHWKGRHVIGRRRRPRQPRTEPQRATRLWSTFLSQQWGSLTIAEKASWSAYEPQKDVPNYNKYLSWNIRQLHSFPGVPVWPAITPNCPSAVYPPTYATDPAGHAPMVPVPGPGSATFGTTINVALDNWVLLWFHTTPGGPWALYKNLIGATHAPTTGDYTITIRDLPPVLYVTGYLHVSRTGKPRLQFVYRSTTPT